MTNVDFATLRARKHEALFSFEDFLVGGGLPKWPLEVFIEVSNLCNLKCAMCGTFSAVSPIKHSHMTEEERGFYGAEAFRESTESVFRHALVVHAFGYGEPTLHPQFRELIEYLTSFGVYVDFFTNGMKLDESLTDFLVQTRVGGVCVSFSGATRETYENLYIGGKFDTVLAGIRNLSEAKKRHNSQFPLIQVNSIGFEHHIAQLVEFVELMASVGVNHISVKEPSPDVKLLNDHISIYRPWIEGPILAQAKQRAQELGVVLDTSVYESSAVQTDEEWTRTRERLVGEQRSCEIPQWKDHVDLRELTNFSKTIDVFPSAARPAAPATAMQVPKAALAAHLEIRSPKQDVLPCMEPFKTMYIKQDGTVKPCCFANRKAPTLGDVGKTTAEEVWRGAGYRATQEAVLNGQYPWKICGNCIEHNHRPRSHYLNSLVSTYGRWFQTSFGELFVDEPTARRIDSAPENEAVVRLHSIVAAGLPTGPRITSEHLPKLDTPASCNIERIIDLPVPADPSKAMSIIEGWAIDAGTSSAAHVVELVVDNTVYPAQYGLIRGDVAQALGTDAYLKSGFWCQVPTQALSFGAHALTVRVIAKDQSGFYSGPKCWINP